MPMLIEPLSPMLLCQLLGRNVVPQSIPIPAGSSSGLVPHHGKILKYSNGQIDILQNSRTGAVTVIDRRDPSKTIVYNDIDNALHNIDPS